jgi:hypothetical protein
MTKRLVLFSLLLTTIFIAGCSRSKEPELNANGRIEDSYVITAHTVVQLKPVYLNGYLQTGLPTQEDDYTVVYGTDILKVKYSDSQTNSAKPGESPMTHEHSYDRDPDLSQVPQVGTPIRHCKLSKDITPDGGPIIDVQPTPGPCMIQFGDTLQYEPSPNAGDGPGAYTYVGFDIISERARIKTK